MSQRLYKAMRLNSGGSFFSIIGYLMVFSRGISASPRTQSPRAQMWYYVHMDTENHLKHRNNPVTITRRNKG